MMAYSDFSKNTLCSVKIYYQQEFFCCCCSLDNRSFPCLWETHFSASCKFTLNFLSFPVVFHFITFFIILVMVIFFISSHLFPTYSPSSSLTASLDLKANLCGRSWKSLKQIMNKLFYSELLDIIHFHVESIRK